MIITMAAYDRPYYLLHALRSQLVAADSAGEDVQWVISIDPSAREHEVAEVVRSTLGSRALVMKNTTHMGLTRNTRQAVLSGYAVGDYVLHLEEDLHVAPDAFLLSAWMRDEYRDDHSVVCTALSNREHTWKLPDEHTVYRTGSFRCHGWGMWKTRWRDRMLCTNGWDHQAPLEVSWLHGDQVVPHLARVRHFGFQSSASEVGDCTPDMIGWCATSIPQQPYHEGDGGSCVVVKPHLSCAAYEAQVQAEYEDWQRR